MPRIILRKRPQTAQYFTEDLDGIGLDMMRIPAGIFVMGTLATEEGSDDGEYERPQHVVRVPEFCLGRYPVTQGQWRVVASWEQVEQKLESEPSNFKGDDLLPVEQVSWLDAKEFCARLNQKTKGKIYRLPSEAEWEYACRAVSSFQSSVVTTEQLSETEEQALIEEWNKKYLKQFSFGETLTAEIANYRASETYRREVEGQYGKETTPVGLFSANDFGLCDMHGNVEEWCEDDWHENYQKAPTDGSAWLDKDDKDTSKVRRGGSWNEYPMFCRTAYRSLNSRDLRYDFIGFRVACSLLVIP